MFRAETAVRRAKQAVLFVTTDEVPKGQTVQFHVVLNAIRARAGFDEFVKNSRGPSRAAVIGLPSSAPRILPAGLAGLPAGPDLPVPHCVASV